MSSVEMAIVVSLLLLFVFAIIEFGRFISTYSAIETASREGARYGSAVGDSDNGIPRYADCAEIREAAKRLAQIVALTDGDISIDYDDGPGSTQMATCPNGGSLDPSAVGSGDRIVVTVTTTFDSGMPLIGTFLDGIKITSTDRRTIFKS